MAIHPISAAFTEAASRLGIAFVPMFVFKPHDGEAIETLGLVSEFGSKQGTLIFSESNRPSLEQFSAIKTAGYFYSILFPSYTQYDQSLFVDTLNDWGYFGNEAKRPSWFTGKTWGAGSNS